MGCRGPWPPVSYAGRRTRVIREIFCPLWLLLWRNMADVLSASSVGRLRRANKAEVAEFFDVSPQAVDGWIRRGCPAVERGARGKSWVFDLLAVAEWRITGGRQDGDVDPEKMSPADRKAWYDGEARRREIQIKDRELIPASEVEQVIATAFSAIAQGLRSLPDNIERRTGCGPDVLEVIEQVIDAEMSSLADRLAKLAPTVDDVAA